MSRPRLIPTALIDENGYLLFFWDGDQPPLDLSRCRAMNPDGDLQPVSPPVRPAANIQVRRDARGDWIVRISDPGG